MYGSLATMGSAMAGRLGTYGMDALGGMGTMARLATPRSMSRAAGFVGRHPKLAVGGGAGVIAAGALGMSSGAHQYRRRRRQGYMF